MDTARRIEHALKASLEHCGGSTAPPRLNAALHHAVFPGGARVRPRVCLAVSSACGDDAPGLADAAAVSIELLHCASLVHDDLPCFDDADIRRGRPSVHAQFGEPIAVLAGDALIVQAFEVLSRTGESHPARFCRLVRIMGQAAGSPRGLVAGQAWESEPNPDLSTYHRAKTGALFQAATMAGAVAAGGDPAEWTTLGDRLGEAYQVADDLGDAVACSEEIGKPVGRDAELSRPSAVRDLGVEGAVRYLSELIQEALESIPRCPGADGLEKLVSVQAKRLVPKALRESAA